MEMLEWMQEGIGWRKYKTQTIRMREVRCTDARVPILLQIPLACHGRC